MDSIHTIQIDIFMVIFLVTILSHALYKLDKKNKIEKYYIALILMTILLTILEVGTVVFDGRDIKMLINLNKVFNALGFSLMPVLTIFFCIITFTWVYPSKKLNSEGIKMLCMPAVINGILSFLSMRHNIIFFVSSNNVYTRGPLFFVPVLLCYVYLIFNCGFIWNNRNKFYEEDICILVSITFILIVASVIQVSVPNFLTIWGGTAISVVVGYISILNGKIRHDPLTGLENRMAYNEYLRRIENIKNISVIIVNIDIDNFKEINDTYGHAVGDYVLKTFAKLMQDTFTQGGRLIRMGGDEFLIMEKGINCYSMNERIKILQHKVDKCNELSDNVKFTFSYGITKFDPRKESISRAMRKSDVLMYNNKRKNE